MDSIRLGDPSRARSLTSFPCRAISSCLALTARFSWSGYCRQARASPASLERVTPSQFHPGARVARKPRISLVIAFAYQNVPPSLLALRRRWDGAEVT